MDYYAVLGLSKGASSDEVKKAFKKKAMKYHPDRTGNDKTAEKKFKEVKEAYDVLSDPQKKSMYDQYGTTDFGGGFGGRSQGGFNSSGFEDIFEEFQLGGLMKVFMFQKKERIAPEFSIVFAAYSRDWRY